MCTMLSPELVQSLLEAPLDSARPWRVSSTYTRWSCLAVMLFHLACVRLMPLNELRVFANLDWFQWVLLREENKWYQFWMTLGHIALSLVIMILVSVTFIYFKGYFILTCYPCIVECWYTRPHAAYMLHGFPRKSCMPIQSYRH